MRSLRATSEQWRAAQRGLTDGSFAIWKGPTVDQADKEVLAANQVASDDFLHQINFYVKGVQGKLPEAH